ncbi:MAG: MFS transporter [Planctomycetota bacterium]
MLEVVRRNPDFRRLWIAQVVSQLGDWFSRMAVLAVIGTLGGGAAARGMGTLFAIELATRLLPTTVLGPLAGPVADRLPRRALMVSSDLVRAGLVLGLLAVDEPDELWLLYLLVISQMGISIFFSAAQSAALPSTVARDELHAAYALSAATWSAMLSIGALGGGLLVQRAGTGAVFVLDALTYVASALLLAGLRLPPVPRHPEPFRLRDVVFLADLRRGYAHVRACGQVPAILAKTFWGGAGGFLVLLPIAASERFEAGGGGAATAGALGFAVGLFYSARGLGTAIGPLLARLLHGSSDPALRRQITAGFLIGAAGYALFALAPSLSVAVLCVVFAHAGGSTLWVASTVIWQKHVDDAFRGRVFALEFLGMTFAFTLGGGLAGTLFDATGSLNAALWTMSIAVLCLGLLWTALAGKLTPLSPRRDEAPAP